MYLLGRDIVGLLGDNCVYMYFAFLILFDVDFKYYMDIYFVLILELGCVCG